MYANFATTTTPFNRLPPVVSINEHKGTILKRLGMSKSNFEAQMAPVFALDLSHDLDWVCDAMQRMHEEGGPRR